jgi:hypothetical protein
MISPIGKAAQQRYFPEPFEAVHLWHFWGGADVGGAVCSVSDEDRAMNQNAEKNPVE